MADQPRITPREFQYRKKFFTDLKKVPKQKLICLACGDRLNLEKGKVFYHKKLGVLLCKECKGKQNAYALTDSCIICNKMAVYICGSDECKNEFCKRCLNRGNPDSVEAAESDGWKCFECLPNPIWEHRAICALVMKSTPKEKSANEESDSADEKPKPKPNYRGMSYTAREKLKNNKDLAKSLRKLVDPESDEDRRALAVNLHAVSSSSEEKTTRTTRKNFVKVHGKANVAAEPPSSSGSHKSPKKKVTFVSGSQKENQESDTESEGRLLKKEPITKDHSLLFKKHLAKVSEDARELYSTFKTEMENLKRRYSKTELKNMNDVVKIVTKFNSTLDKFRDNTENEQEKLFHSYKSFCKVAGKKAVPIKKQKPVLLLRKKKVASSDEEKDTEVSDSDDRIKRKKTLSTSSSEKEEVEHFFRRRTSMNKKSALPQKRQAIDSSDQSEEEKESEAEKKGNTKSAPQKNQNRSSSSSPEKKETKKDSPKKDVSKVLNKSINSSRSMIESSSDEFVDPIDKNRRKLNIPQKESHSKEKVHTGKEKRISSPVKESPTKTKQTEKSKKKIPPKTTSKDGKAANHEKDGCSSAMEVSSMDSDVDSEAGKKQNDPKKVNENPDVDIHDADTDCEKAKAQIGARLSVRKDLLTPHPESLKKELPTFNSDPDEIIVLSSDPLTTDEAVPETTKVTEKDEAENERSGCKKGTDKEAETSRISESEIDTEKDESTDNETVGKKAADKDSEKKKKTRNAKAIVDSNSEEAEEDNTTKAEDARKKTVEKKKNARKSTSESRDDEAEKDSTADDEDARKKVAEEEEQAKRLLLQSSDSEAEMEDTTKSKASRKKAAEKEKKTKKSVLKSSDSEAEEDGTTNSEANRKKAIDIKKKKVKKSLFGVSDAEKEETSASSEEVAKKVTDEEDERAKKSLLESSCSDTENEDTITSKAANKKGSDAQEKVADKEKAKKTSLESSGAETDNEDANKSKDADKNVTASEEERAKKNLLESSDSEAETTIQSKSQENDFHSDSTVVMENGSGQLKQKNESTEKKADKKSKLTKQDEKKSSKRDSDGSESEKENQNNDQETQKKRKIVDASSEDDLKKTRDKKKRAISKDDSSSGEQEDQDENMVPERMENTFDEEERAKKSLLASSSSGSDDSDSENKKPNPRNGNRSLNLRKNNEKKFKVKNNLHYKADIKLRIKCSVLLKRLKKKQLKGKRHQLALRRSAKRVNENRLKSLLSLENLEKNKQKNKTKESESDGSDSEMLTRKQKRQKLAEEKDSLLNHLNKTNDCSVNKEESDSSTSTSLSKAKIDNDKIFSKDELFDMANERAKRKLLESDDDTEICDLTENSEEKEEKKEAKKKGKNKKEGNESEDGNEKDCESDNDDAKEKKSEKNKWKNDKLLKGKIIDSSDSDNEKKMEKLEDKMEKAKLAKDNSDSENASSPAKSKMKKKKVRQRRVLDSDSDGKKQASTDDESSTSSMTIAEEKTDAPKKKKRRAAKTSDSSDSEPRPKTKRRRIKKVSSESNSSDEDALSSQNSSLKGRKNIRKVIEDKHIADDTKQAAIEEEERLKRIADRQKLYNEMYESRLAGEAKVEKLVLDFDEETKEEVLRVDDELVKKLKPHQAKGIKFMWDACFESLERTKSTKGSGCIIAHCMGLGKTFQVVTLSHTLLNCEETGIKTVMIVCPLSTVLNWKNEFKMWLKNAKNGDDIEIFELTKLKKNQERKFMLEHWQRQGGVLIIGYEMYRNLTSAGKKMRKRDLESIMASLVDPGPDLVVCDEGHLLKNEQSALSQAMRRVRTSRRIVLTGTPLQNNLTEYHCMVQFVKPNLLGTKKEFLNRFVNPITNGQYEDSTQYDVKLMKKRAHVLHKMLEGSVQRFDYSVLTPFLPPKQEYVIFVHLTEVQKKMYQHYLENFARRHKGAGGSLFADFQALQRIWTHPKVMKYNDEREEARKEKVRLDDDSEGSLKDFIDDGSASDSSDNSDSGSVQSIHSGNDKEVAPARRRTRANAIASDLEPELVHESREPAWWEQFVEKEHFDDMRISVKLMLLFAIIKECEQIGDKLLVFSQSLYSLSLIEEFLAKIDESTQDSQELETLDKHTGSWSLGQDYFRLDGQTSAENRSIWCKNFNRESNTRARLFLISTRAGGLGINLTAANRVVIFDASWNPSHDVQSIFRIYRFGQKKPCYIYRFLAAGTMEEKIYKRQVAKLSLACRVVDEQQIERHYSGHNLAELYSFDDSEPEEKTLNCPKDRLLAEIFLKYPKAVKDYLEHDSLLENKEDEELDESERQQAWQEYEDEKKGKRPMNMMDMGMMGMMPDGVGGANSDFNLIYQMIQHDYPLASHQQIMAKVTQTINNMYQNFDNSHFLQNSIAQQQQYPITNQNTTMLQQQLQQKQQREHQNYLQQLQYSQAYGNRVPNARFPGPSHQAAHKAPSSAAPTRFNHDDDIEIIPAEPTAASSSLLNDKRQEE